MATRRQNRVSQRLRQEISKILLYELNDPRLKGVVTVTRVEISADLQNARVYLSVMGEEKEQRLSLAAIRHARGHIQHVLGDRLEFRRTPKLSFHIDETVKRGIRISSIIAQIAREREEAEGAEEKSEDEEAEE